MTTLVSGFPNTEAATAVVIGGVSPPRLSSAASRHRTEDVSPVASGRYRFDRYAATSCEFFGGATKLKGTPFGTTGSRDDSGNDFSKALDGNVETFFDGVEPNNLYVGIDLGPDVQAAAPMALFHKCEIKGW